VDAIWWAVGLVLVLEGLMPFASPTKWRRYMTELLKLADGQLRAFGLFAVTLGLVIMWIAR
jgi:uncharacterized protein YjeT (DUF2065 family)